MTRRHPRYTDPDAPSTAEVVGAICLAVVLVFALWFASILATPIP